MKFQINNKKELEEFVTHNWNEINQFIDQLFTVDLPPIYSSVDIRESKSKFAPVDMNIYPAGFNNLCQLDLDASGKHFTKAIKNLVPNAKKVAIIPESHTKNLFYLDHLGHLKKVIEDEGFSVEFVSLDKNLFEYGQKNLTLLSHSKFEIQITEGHIQEGQLTNENCKFDLGILNNDQSSILDVPWDDLKTPIVPSPKIGWFRRQKSEHFQFYKEVVDEFSRKFSINQNLLMANFVNIDEVDFSSKIGLEKIAHAVDSLKDKLTNDSKIFVKASQGTYGMGISVVSSGKDIINMNRKNRDKMDIGKNKIKFTSVVIQEGVDSILKYDELPAEVTIYLVNGKATGGFVRANTEKDASENLNSKGMVFKKYCISEIHQHNDYQCKEAVYSIIARLSTLAGAKEISNVNKEEK